MPNSTTTRCYGQILDGQRNRIRNRYPCVDGIEHDDLAKAVVFNDGGRYEIIAVPTVGETYGLSVGLN